MPERAFASAHDNTIIEVVNNFTMPASQSELTLTKASNVLMRSAPGEHFTISSPGTSRFIILHELTDLTITNLTLEGFGTMGSDSVTGGTFYVGLHGPCALTLTVCADCATKWAYGGVEETESCWRSVMYHQAKGEQPKTFIQLFFS